MAITAPTPRTEHEHMDRDAFHNVVTYDGFHPQGMQHVIDGESPLTIFKGAMDPQQCDRFMRAFYKDLDRLDTYKVAPKIYTIGGSLFTIKDLMTWLEQAPVTRRRMEELFQEADATNFLVEYLHQTEQEMASQGIVFRPAQHEDREAFYSIIRGWGMEGVDTSGNAARVHEDQDQILHPLQHGFEVQATYDTPQGSMNCCYGQGAEGGELVIWNKRPTHDELANNEDQEQYRYGMAGAYMDGVDHVEFRPEAGDMYILRSDLLHAVHGTRGEGKRVTAATLHGNTNMNGAQHVAENPHLRQKYNHVAQASGRSHEDIRTILYWS